MGNKLTVTNQSADDVIVGAHVNHLVLDSVHANVQVSLPSGMPSVGLGFDVNRKDDNLGSITITTGRSWTFPMITGRYNLTISKRDTGEALCTSLEIPWHTDVTINNDNTLAYVKTADALSNKSDIRRGDLNQLKRTTGVPRCIIKVFLTHPADDQEHFIREISEHITHTREHLSEKLHEQRNELSKDANETVLKAVLIAEPFYMAPEDVTTVVNKLISGRQTKKKLAKLVVELANKS